jgi:hypothetical protein
LAAQAPDALPADAAREHSAEERVRDAAEIPGPALAPQADLHVGWLSAAVQEADLGALALPVVSARTAISPEAVESCLSAQADLREAVLRAPD